MNNILLYSDLHITQSCLKECSIILEEISMLANKYKIDTLINLGDTFDGLKPSSSELDIFATFIKNNNDKKHIIIAASSHESETNEISILNHYGILTNNVQIVKEYKDESHLFCGHFFLKESNKNFGAKLSKENFKNYLYVFLGHQHSYELLKPNVCHLGSSRYVDFAEADDKQKIVAIISDYGTEAEQVHFLKLKSPIPMKEFILKNGY
jgi:DNA repair exonuclease SbcCD nuclease subunit